MSTIVVSPANVAIHPQGGGHFWVYLQYVLGLRELGCEVLWLERFDGSGDEVADRALVASLRDRLAAFGLTGGVLLYASGPDGEPRWRDVETAHAERQLARADLLLNFHYAMSPAVLGRFRRTALIDIDPGLLQHWLAHGQLQTAAHNLYFSTGENVGRPGSRVPDAGRVWHRTRPLVCLSHWPMAYEPGALAFTTVSGWWGDEWLTDERSFCFENNKRVSFLQFAALPQHTPQRLELALALGDGQAAPPPAPPDPDDARPTWLRVTTDHRGDAAERALMERQGWRIRHAREVSASPQEYQTYIQRSRGEFSCAKPSCMFFQNAWVSDRSVCYLASGKPVVVQDTGPSEYLPNGEGLFRFNQLDEAAQALATINADYRRHAGRAREIAQTWFDSRPLLAAMLNTALQPAAAGS